MRLISILALLLGAALAQAQTTINAVYFGQTHVLKATDPYFGLVGNREALIKVHVVNPATPASPAVTATLTASGLPNLVLPLTGPATLPASIPDGLGVVQHSFANTFTGYIPANYMKTGLQVTVNAGAGVSTTITNMKVGAPTKVIMTMTDVQYFSDTNSNYPAGTFEELEAKWPVADLEIRRLGHVVFPELVIPPRPDVGTKAVRIKSKSEYTIKTGLSFDGEQAAALAWNGALKRAAGRSGRWSLYYLNVYNAFAGGQAGGFAGVGAGNNLGILHHELGHALSLPHWGDSGSYPYKGAMHGISAPANYNQTHSGPAWAFDLRTRGFIPPTVQAGNVGGKPVGTYKVDPMQGGGTGYQEPGYLMNHFSDYSINQMRSYLHSHMVVWNQALNSYASWNQTAGDYTTTVSNNGVQFPTTRDAEVISIMASISGSDPGVTMVYPPIGPYTAGLIRLFDPTVAADRTAAQSIFSPANGSDLCVRVVQGGVTKTYMLAASWLTNQDPKSSGSLVTEAINLPASGGAVTKIELLLTPDAEDNGLPANPQVLSTWAPLTPEPAAFESAPVAYSPSAITMKAKVGEVAFGYTGTVEYKFTETTGNPGATSSAWQTSRSYTDTGLQANTQYSYTVSMRAGSLIAANSAAASANTLAASATNNVTVNSTQQFSLVANLEGFQAVTGLGSFNAGTADKLVVVISTEDKNNSGTGYVYGVRYNGKTMKEAIQEHGGSANGSAAIFYLDNPGSIGTGTIQVSAELPNGGIGTAYALSNTMTGFGVTNSRSGSTANSVSLTTAGERSMVIAVLANSGSPNSAGTPAANAPLTPVSSGSWGSGWGSHASGYQLVAAPAVITPTFSTLTGGSYNINIAAAEFPGKPGTVPVLLPNVWTQTDGGAQNWTTASNWDDGVVPNPTSTTTMDFSTVDLLADTALNLGANRTARIWKFGDTSGTENWIVNAGNSITLAGTTPTIQVNNNTTQLDNVVAGTAGLTKTGVGTLELRGANPYTGGTTLTTGTLQFAKLAAMPASGSVAVGTGTTLAVNVGGTDEWTTATTGNGSIGGLLAGTGGQGAPVTYAGTATVGFDTSNAGGTQTYAGVISNVGTTLGLMKLGIGTLTLTAANTYTGATTINGGTLQFSGSGRLNSGSYSGAISIGGDAVLDYAASGTQTLSGAITGGGTLKNSGGGGIILTNKDNDFGALTLTSGRVFANNNAGALPSAVEVAITGGNLVFGFGATRNNVISVSSGGALTARSATNLGNVKLPGTGTVVFNDDDASTGILNITNDQITDEYDPVTGELIATGAQVITGNLTLQVGGSRMTTTTASLGGVIFAGKITGPGSLTVASGGNSGNTNGLFRSGVLTLTGSNDYAGGTTITTGTLALGNSDVIPNTPLAIANGKLDAATFSDTLGTLTITGSATINLGDGATLSFADSSAVNWPGTLTLAGNFVSGSSIRFGNNGTALTASQLSKIGSTAFSSFSLNSNGYLVGTPTGGPTYTITNTTTDANGTCTPTGVTTVGGGGSQTYTLTPNPGYAVATLTVNGAPVTPALSYTFDNVAANQTIGATFVNIAEAPLHWDSNGSTPGFGSTMGTWGSSAFWTVDASGATACIAVSTETNTSVNFGSATLNYNQSAVSITDGGVNAGNITFGAGQSTPLTLGGGTITLGDTAVITVNNSSNTIASVLAGADTSLTKAGTGILTLSGANIYTGDTILSTGTLKLGANNVLPDGPGKGNVSLTGTLDLNTFYETLNGLTGNGTVDTLAGGTPTLTLGGANATSTFPGTITDTAGTLSLIKTGSGTLTLAGANDYSGSATISSGILALSGAGTLGGPSSALALSGGQLDLGGLSRTQGAVSITAAASVGDTMTNGTLNGTSFTASNNMDNAIISSSLTGPGGFTKSADGTVTLSAANSYAGMTTISGGILQFAKTASLYSGTTGNWTAANIAVASGGTLALNVGGTNEFTTANVTTLLTNLGGANGTSTGGFASGGRIGFDTTNSSGGAFTVADNIANSSGTGGGAIGVTKLGTGTLVLTNATNGYIGSTTISSGTLRLSGSGRLNSGNYAGAISIAPDATLDHAGGGQTLSGAITGGGTLIRSSSNDLILTNSANAYGALILSNSGGRVFINNNVGALPAAATVTVTSGNLVFGFGTTRANDISVSSGGTLTARNATTLENVTLPGSGSVIFNNDDSNTNLLTISNDQTLTAALTVQVGGSRMQAGTTTLGGVTLSGKLSGNGSLVVTSSGGGGNSLSGTGVLTLSGPNDYTGDTTVNSGVLAVTGTSIPDTGKLVINGGKVNLSNAETVSTLFFGATQQPSGTYSAADVPAGATITTASFSGSGTLIVAYSAYSLWASTNAPTTGINPNADEDNDGVGNAVEFVLGGDALTNDLTKLPSVSISGDNILFSFKRIQTSINASTALSIKVGTTLQTWPGSYTVGADTATSTTGVTVQKGVPAGFDTITLSVPRAPDLQKFLRLQVTITP